MRAKRLSLSILILSVLLISALAISIISAIEVTFSKENYNPQETLQVEITGNFLEPLVKENILIYQGDKVHSTPVVSDLTKQDRVYYFYAVLPNQEGNFSLRIEDAKYTQEGEEKEDTIITEFKIEKTNASILKINPGFILTLKENLDFSIKITSPYEDQTAAAELEATGETQTLSLIESSEKTMTFSISEITTSQTNLKINDYNIPIFIILEAGEIPDDENKTEDTDGTSDEDDTDDEDRIDTTDMTEDQVAALSCSDIGEICEAEEECDDETKESLDGPCCVGKCKKPGKGFNKIIGGILILIVLIVIAYFYKKSKKRQRINPDDILGDKIKKIGR